MFRQKADTWWTRQVLRLVCGSWCWSMFPCQILFLDGVMLYKCLWTVCMCLYSLCHNPRSYYTTRGSKWKRMFTHLWGKTDRCNREHVINQEKVNTREVEPSGVVSVDGVQGFTLSWFDVKTQFQSLDGAFKHRHLPQALCDWMCQQIQPIETNWSQPQLCRGEHLRLKFWFLGSFLKNISIVLFFSVQPAQYICD